MDANLTTAIVSASATALVAIVALLQNSKRMDRIEKQLDVITSDLKEFFRTLSEHDKRIQRLEDLSK